MPPDYKLVAYPPEFRPTSAILVEMLKGKPVVSEPGLEGWQVYAR